MSDILITVNEQNLHITDTPKIAAQGVKENNVVFSFSDDWTGFGKVAVFYADDNPAVVYQSIVDSTGRAVIPWEITNEAGKICIGVTGVKDDVVKTSEILKYKIVKGLYVVDTAPPTPGIYEQMLTIAGSISDSLAVVSEQIDNIVAESTNGMLSGSRLIAVDLQNIELNSYGVANINLKPANYAFLSGSDISVLSIVGYKRNALNEIVYAETQYPEWQVRSDNWHTSFMVEGWAGETISLKILFSVPYSADFTEVTDIRIGVDGVTYQSAGRAIREQVTGLQDQIDTLNDGGLIIGEEVVAENVANWLDNHPEATTTIPNGSIEEIKLSESLSLKTIKDYVTPQMFGAKANGTTDDSAAIQAAINDGRQVFIPKGSYRINTPITIYNKYQWTLYAESADIIYTGNDYALKFRALRNSNIYLGSITANNGGCIYFDGSDHAYWTQYDNFYFKYLSAGPNSACVKAEQSGSNSWINEIRWHNGRLYGGLYGFHLVRNTPNNNMSHWNFHEIGVEGVTTGFKFESADDGKVIGSFMFDCCRHEPGEINTLIETTGAVTKMTWFTQAAFPYKKMTIDSGATDWEIYCPYYDSMRVINGGIVRIDKMYSLDGGIILTSSSENPFDLQSIHEIGNYYCSKNAESATMLNCPTQKSFLLKVEDKGGDSTHAAANYRYLRYRLIDFDDVEYMCTASTNNAGETWTFGNWKVNSNAWTVINN